MRGDDGTWRLGSCLVIGGVLCGGCAQSNPAVGYPQPYAGPSQPFAGPAWSGAPGSVPLVAPQPQAAPPNAAVPATPPTGYPALRPRAAAFPNLQRPKWRAPGTIAQQRQQAEIYDPYASVDAAPVIDGGRPRDFLYPIAEPAQSAPFRRANPF